MLLIKLRWSSVPVPHPAALAAQGVEFQAPAQLQRGGLLLLDGVAYAGYGGNSGDCQECEFFCCTLTACRLCDEAVRWLAQTEVWCILICASLLLGLVHPCCWDYPGGDAIKSGGRAVSIPGSSARSLLLATHVADRLLLITAHIGGRAVVAHPSLLVTETSCEVGFVMHRSRPGGGRADRRPLHRVQLQHLRQQGR